MKLLLFLIFVGAHFSSSVQKRIDDTCPPSGDIYPCFCAKNVFYTVLECDSADLQSVKSALKNVSGKNISLQFRNIKFGDIPSDFFQEQLTEDLAFSNCEISSFGDRPFKGLEDTLTWLNIDNSINNSKTFSLGHFKKLSLISLADNNIKKVGNDWFKGVLLQSLERVSLQNNNIEELEDQAFSDLVFIWSLNLDLNHIKSLSRTMFPKPALKMHNLGMSFCQIEVLPDDIFTEMPALRAITLDGNKIKTLSESAWKPVWGQLQQVSLDKNPLECDLRMKWMYERSLRVDLSGHCYGNNTLTGKMLEELTEDSFLE